MLSDEEKKKIDSLTKDEIRLEINKETRSIFQRDGYAYLQTRFQIIEEDERKKNQLDESKVQQQSLFYSKLAILVAIITSILSLTFGSGWYQEYEDNNEEAVRILKSVSKTLDQNKEIYEELSSAQYSERGWGILESYLIRIRRDGVPTHALMKQRIDSLVKNNNVAVGLLSSYSDFKLPELEELSSEYIEHATRYNDRWASLLEIYTSGAPFPTGVPVFPAQLPEAIVKELKLRGAK